MIKAEIIAALNAADISTGRYHLSADERRFWRVETPAGQLRYEKRGGWAMDTIALGDCRFRLVDFGGVTGVDERLDLIEAISSVMDRLTTALSREEILGRLDLDRKDAADFIERGYCR